jgi:hypothetical protein
MEMIVKNETQAGAEQMALALRSVAEMIESGEFEVESGGINMSFQPTSENFGRRVIRIDSDILLVQKAEFTIHGKEAE